MGMGPTGARATIAFPGLKSQYHVIDSTHTRGALDDGIEHRLHVRGRSADDAEDLGRCSLMLRCLGQFRVVLPEFLES
jgi:hypothetical protein